MGSSLKTTESFDEIMRLYIPMVYAIALERLGNAADAEDVTQEVFIRYYNADKTFESEEHRRFFLIRVAVNCSNSFAKSSWHRHRALCDPDDILGLLGEKTANDETAEENERKRAVIEAVMKLPEKYRTAVHLFYFEDLSIAQIAEITGEKESTVKSHLSRAREKLKKLLNIEEFE